MKKYIKIILSNVIINSILIIFTFIAIQNSKDFKKVNLIFFETISLPISFILSSSFVAGSFTSSLLLLNFVNKQNN
tara:strand:- start:2606 stop:2833 length:228 start_codon:yes stop_codon:yes gene_type:complete